MKKTFLKISSKINEDNLFLFTTFLFWFSVFITFFVFGISNLDPDFPWHLRVGQDIILNRQAPFVEEYIFPTLGEHWVDHEWLSNLMLFLVYNFFGKFGYWALGVFFAMTATFTLLVISKTTQKYFVRKLYRWNFLFLSCLFTTLGLFSLFRSYGIRLQVITWLFFTLCFVFYFKLSIEKRWKYLIIFPLLFCVWANMHGTFVLGIVITFSLLAILFWQNKNPFIRLKIILSAVATALVTLLTPYNTELWKLIAGEYTQNTSYLIRIFEWLPLYAAPYISWYPTIYISIIIFIFLLYLPIFKKNPQKTNMFLYFGFVFFILLLSVQARRFVPMFVLCSIPLAIFITSQLTKGLVIKKWFGFLMVFIAVPLIAYKIFFITTVPLDLLTLNAPISPYNAMLFLKNDPSLSKYNIYNRYGWGGYLVLMWPEKLHFIDGRMPQKPLSDGTSLIEEYFKFQESEDAAREKIQQYDIQIALLDKKYSAKETFSPFNLFVLKYFFSIDLEDFDEPDFLRQYLAKNWKLIYEDEFSVVYINPAIEKSSRL